MKRCFRLIVFVLVFNSVPLFGQGSLPETKPLSGSESSTNQWGNEHGVYTSGFAVLNTRNAEKIRDYASNILMAVRGKWYPRIGELQKSTEMKRGTTVVQFEIKKDGSVGKMTTFESSGTGSLDEAAQQAIASSSPFAHLPEAYSEEALKLEMRFGYNQPTSTEAPFCDGPNWGARLKEEIHHVGNGVKAPRATYAPDPEYSEEARKTKYQSEVTVAGTVDPEGTFTDLCLAQAAGSGLDVKAMEAVRTWKFEPATLQGQPVAVRIVVEVDFKLY